MCYQTFIFDVFQSTVGISMALWPLFFRWTIKNRAQWQPVLAQYIMVNWITDKVMAESNLSASPPWETVPSKIVLNKGWVFPLKDWNPVAEQEGIVQKKMLSFPHLMKHICVFFIIKKIKNTFSKLTFLFHQCNLDSRKYVLIKIACLAAHSWLGRAPQRTDSKKPEMDKLYDCSSFYTSRKLTSGLIQLATLIILLKNLWIWILILFNLFLLRPLLPSMLSPWGLFSKSADDTVQYISCGFSLVRTVVASSESLAAGVSCSLLETGSHKTCKDAPFKLISSLDVTKGWRCSGCDCSRLQLLMVAVLDST